MLLLKISDKTKTPVVLCPPSRVDHILKVSRVVRFPYPLGSWVPTVISDCVEPFHIHWVFRARHSIEGFTTQDLSSGECSDPHDDLWGWYDHYSIVQSKELRLGDGGTCPASEWEGLAGKAISDRPQRVRWEARCFLLVFLMRGPSWAGERGCWVCPLPARPSAVSQGTPCFLLGEAWKILFCLLSLLERVLNVILPEPTTYNSPELGTQDPATFPAPLHPHDSILRTRTQMRLCFLVSFPGCWFLVNILQMKGLIYVQAVHIICLTPYTLFRGFWDHLFIKWGELDGD